MFSAAQEWRDAFDAVMAGYDPDRARSQAHVLDVVQRRVGTPGVILDLGCGSGALLETARTRWPSAHVLGVDNDPVLIGLARTRAGGLDIHDLDVLQPGWTASLPVGGIDAVVSTTSLHDVPEAAVPALARDVATLLRPGGVLVNWDAFFPHESGRPTVEAPIGDASAWQLWWQDLRRAGVEVPQLSALLRERDERRARPRAYAAGPAAPEVWSAALSAAGFVEVEVGHRRGDHGLLVATHRPAD